MKPLPIFVGWDGRESIAYHVFAHSILRRASIPVAIIPLVQGMLCRQKLYTRARHATEATEFSLTRFLAPSLAGYEGLALFADCDMLMRADIATLPLTLPDARTRTARATTLGAVQECDSAFDLNAAPDVWCCQHDYTPRAGLKMDGLQQTAYPKKNWSSFMLFNARRCRGMTPAYVNSATPKDLHRFEWATGGGVGVLPLEWNHLVGEYDHSPAAKNLHYTLGGPWFKGYENGDHTEEWYAERNHMLGVTVAA